MDYGHTTSLADSPAPEFFTSGIGTNDENVNNLDAREAEDNLDLTNQGAIWEQSAPTSQTSHNEKPVNGEIVAPPEGIYSPLEQPPTPELGEITPYFPPGANPEPLADQPKDAKTDASIIEKSLAPDLDAIKTTDRLSEQSVKTIDNSIDRFNQGSIDAADFYEEVRDAMETNIGNSYNRKLGETA